MSTVSITAGQTQH